MAMTTAADVPVQILVKDLSAGNKPLILSERRITPSWTIAHLKTKLEPVTGIPSSSQILKIRALDGQIISLDDENSLIGDSRWGLRRGVEIEVVDTRPPSARQNFTDVSSVEKYQMPEDQYEKLSDSVLAWKKRQKLGRFDPSTKSAAELAAERKQKDLEEISTRKIKEGLRCRIGRDDGRRGMIRFVGEIEGLGGDRELGCVWVGVELDEPVGRNNGSIQVESSDGQRTTTKVFECKDNFGVFARPEKIEVGDWPPLDDLALDEDMEEI